MVDIYTEVVKCSKQLMFKEPFYGLFLISLNKELNDKIPTACVSKENINLKLSINPKFWGSLDKNTQMGVLKHELLHIGFFHLNMFDQYPNKTLFNIACDLEVNQYIYEDQKGEKWDGLELNKFPYNQLTLESKAGVKYYYEKLKDEQENNPNGDVAKHLNELESNNQNGSGDGLGHDLWEEFSNLSEAEKKLIQKQIDHNLKNIAQELKKGSNWGSIPGELQDYIKNLFEEKPAVIDWKSYLRRFSSKSQKVLTKKTRYKSNRRFTVNPALKIKPQKNTLVAIDTSASVGDNDLAEFFNEIHHIYKTGIEITIVECDTQIQRIYEYKGKKENIKVHGRGGTIFQPVIDYLSTHRDSYGNLIYLTDGEANIPTNIPNKPILWVHCSTCRINEDLPGNKIQIQK